MEDFPRQSLAKTVLFRPITTQPQSTRVERCCLPTTLSIRKIVPATKRIPLCEIKLGEKSFNTTCTLRKTLRHVKNQIQDEDNEESPSLLVPDNIVKEYLNATKSVKNKSQILHRLSRLSRLSQKPKLKDSESKSSRLTLQFLKRESSQADPKKKHQRMFDYNDIFSIANGKIKFKK